MIHTNTDLLINCILIPAVLTILSIPGYFLLKFGQVRVDRFNIAPLSFTLGFSIIATFLYSISRFTTLTPWDVRAAYGLICLSLYFLSRNAKLNIEHRKCHWLFATSIPVAAMLFFLCYTNLTENEEGLWVTYHAQDLYSHIYLLNQYVANGLKTGINYLVVGNPATYLSFNEYINAVISYLFSIDPLRIVTIITVLYAVNFYLILLSLFTQFARNRFLPSLFLAAVMIWIIFARQSYFIMYQSRGLGIVVMLCFVTLFWKVKRNKSGYLLLALIFSLLLGSSAKPAMALIFGLCTYIGIHFLKVLSHNQYPKLKPTKLSIFWGLGLGILILSTGGAEFVSFTLRQGSGIVKSYYNIPTVPVIWWCIIKMVMFLPGYIGAFYYVGRNIISKSSCGNPVLMLLASITVSNILFAFVAMADKAFPNWIPLDFESLFHMPDIFNFFAPNHDFAMAILSSVLLSLVLKKPSKSPLDRMATAGYMSWKFKRPIFPRLKKSFLLLFSIFTFTFIFGVVFYLDPNFIQNQWPFKDVRFLLFTIPVSLCMMVGLLTNINRSIIFFSIALFLIATSYHHANYHFLSVKNYFTKNRKNLILTHDEIAMSHWVNQNIDRHMPYISNKNDTSYNSSYEALFIYTPISAYYAFGHFLRINGMKEEKYRRTLVHTIFNPDLGSQERKNALKEIIDTYPNLMILIYHHMQKTNFFDHISWLSKIYQNSSISIYQTH